LKTIFFITTLALIVACNPVGETAKESKAEPAKNIDPSILDDQLVNEDGTINIVLSDSAAVLYNQAFEKNQKDSIAPYYLMKSADIQRHIPGKALLAIKKYITLTSLYPKHKLAPIAMFMSGLTFDENLNDKPRAALVYEDFIKKYPNHEMAAEATNLLALAQNTESTDLDQVHEWQKQENKNN
jgi:outer membrane protein assembly factor BamD (BamD/ComL family)